MDLAVSEEHGFPSEVTSHPVEQGPDISDHIRNLPEEITLESIVSDTPIGEVAADPSRQAAGPDAPLPSADALQKLREIRAARRPVTVETSLGTFENMALENLTVPRDAQKTGGLFFTATFRRMNLVTNKRTRRRVATPLAGAGGKAAAQKKALDAFKVVETYFWRMGVHAGDPVRGLPAGTAGTVGTAVEVPTFEWAYVNATRTTESREQTNDQKTNIESAPGPVGSGIVITGKFVDRNTIYRFEGRASPRIARVFGVTAGKRLNNSQVQDFLADRARDRDIAAESRKGGIADGTLPKEQRNLPAKVRSVDRFQRGTKPSPAIGKIANDIFGGG